MLNNDAINEHGLVLAEHNEVLFGSCGDLNQYA